MNVVKGDKTTPSHGYTFIPTNFKGGNVTVFLSPAKYLNI